MLRMTLLLLLRAFSGCSKSTAAADAAPTSKAATSPAPKTVAEVAAAEAASADAGAAQDPPTPEGAVRAAQDMAASVCACKDLDCAMKAAAEGTKQLDRFRNMRGTRAAAELIIEAGRQTAECTKKLASPPQ
jgi:hypothetical protein